MLKDKIVANKEKKKKKLLDAAYKLFMSKGINQTTINDIVEEADVAKGTFYLYYRDKYDIQEKITIDKSKELFNNAVNALNKNIVTNFEDEIIFVINYIIDELIKYPELIKFFSKDLSIGLYSGKINDLIENKEIGLYKLFMDGIKENNIKLDNPDITLFMIVELVSSTCFSSLTKSIPLPIEEFKPYLFNTIRNLINK